MSTKRTSTALLAAAGSAALLSASLVSPASGAAAPAPAQHRGGRAHVAITIKAHGDDLSGTISSPRPQVCADKRMVLIVVQKGGRGGGDDMAVFSAVSKHGRGHTYTWDAGHIEVAGRFYARLEATRQCRAATSKTVRAVLPHH